MASDIRPLFAFATFLVLVGGMYYLSMASIGPCPPGEITPTASIYARQSPSTPGNWTISVIGLSQGVRYEDLYIVISLGSSQRVVRKASIMSPIPTCASGPPVNRHFELRP